jgi:hypothetical protein
VRRRVADVGRDISAYNVACGPYIIAWIVKAIRSATNTSATDPVFTIQNMGKANTAMSAVPIRGPAPSRQPPACSSAS